MANSEDFIAVDENGFVTSARKVCFVLSFEDVEEWTPCKITAEHWEAICEEVSEQLEEGSSWRDSVIDKLRTLGLRGPGAGENNTAEIEVAEEPPIVNDDSEFRFYSRHSQFSELVAASFSFGPDEDEDDEDEDEEDDDEDDYEDSENSDDEDE